jgi:hypothetical protein
MHAHDGTEWSRFRDKAEQFVRMLSEATAADKALLLIKGGQHWPTTEDRIRGYIDVWWILHDGGIMLLLAHLLQRSKVWRECKLRIHTVAEVEDDIDLIHDKLKEWLKAIRIEAETEVVTVDPETLEPYTFDATERLQERQDVLHNLEVKLGKKHGYLSQDMPVAELDEMVSSVSRLSTRRHSTFMDDDIHRGTRRNRLHSGNSSHGNESDPPSTRSTGMHNVYDTMRSGNQDIALDMPRSISDDADDDDISAMHHEEYDHATRIACVEDRHPRRRPSQSEEIPGQGAYRISSDIKRGGDTPPDSGRRGRSRTDTGSHVGSGNGVTANNDSVESTMERNEEQNAAQVDATAVGVEMEGRNIVPEAAAVAPDDESVRVPINMGAGAPNIYVQPPQERGMHLSPSNAQNSNMAERQRSQTVGYPSHSSQPEPRQSSASVSHGPSSSNRHSGDSGYYDAPEELLTPRVQLRQNQYRQLNSHIRYLSKTSKRSSLVIMNLPDPNEEQSAVDYMQYVQILTKGCPRVMLVHGTGHEVISGFNAVVEDLEDIENSHGDETPLETPPVSPRLQAQEAETISPGAPLTPRGSPK